MLPYAVVLSFTTRQAIVEMRCLTSSRVVTGHRRFTAHVGWLKVAGISVEVVAPGAADDKAPLTKCEK